MEKIEQGIPKDVKKELDVALIKIGEVLAEANEALRSAGHEDFVTVAASLYYNDPNLYCRVPSLKLVIWPFYSDMEVEDEICTITEKEEIVVYSPAAQSSKSLTLASTSMSLKCSAKNEGKRCNGTKRCKGVYFDGKGMAYLCLPAS